MGLQKGSLTVTCIDDSIVCSFAGTVVCLRSGKGSAGTCTHVKLDHVGVACLRLDEKGSGAYLPVLR